MEGVYRFDETEHYLNGMGEMLSKLKIANCRLYFEERPKDAPWFFIKGISIHDGEQHYSELCGSTTVIRELECVDGKTVDSSWIEAVDRRTEYDYQ